MLAIIVKNKGSDVLAEYLGDQDLKESRAPENDFIAELRRSPKQFLADVVRMFTALHKAGLDADMYKHQYLNLATQVEQIAAQPDLELYLSPGRVNFPDIPLDGQRRMAITRVAFAGTQIGNKQAKIDSLTFEEALRRNWSLNLAAANGSGKTVASANFEDIEAERIALSLRNGSGNGV